MNCQIQSKSQLGAITLKQKDNDVYDDGHSNGIDDDLGLGYVHDYGHDVATLTYDGDGHDQEHKHDHRCYNRKGHDDDHGCDSNP